MAALLAVLLLFAAAYWLLRQTEAEAIDPQTLCPRATGPTAMTAILFDLTDSISPTQSRQLNEYIEREITAAPRGTQFTLGQVDENPENWDAIARLCKPATDQDVNFFTSNPKKARARYEREFLSPLHDSIRKMISAKPACHSPIMEALQALLAATPEFLTFPGPRRVIIVSDLLQHSDILSFYHVQRDGYWSTFSASPDFRRLGRTLEGADILIFQIPRASTDIRPAMVEDFWLRYLAAQGSHLPIVKRLGDL